MRLRHLLRERQEDVVRLRSESKRAGQQIQTLADAAPRALQTVQSERLPLAYIAERGGQDQAPYWFANNMLRVVSVLGRPSATSSHEELTTQKLEGLALDANMSALRTAGGEKPKFVGLRVPHAQFVKYIEWMRTTH
jgi:hypothetical protein